jgi:hypothetical protein
MKTKLTRSRRNPSRGRQTRQNIAIVQYLKRYLNVESSQLISSWQRLFRSFVKNEGKLNACKRAKGWYDVSLRLASRLKLEPLPFVKADKDGFPRILRFVKPLLVSESANERRAGLTIMQLYKLHIVQGSYSLESITKPTTAQENPEFIKEYDFVLSQMFPPKEMQDRISLLRADLHVSGKNGPNGPMLYTSFVDREAIRGTNIEDSVKKLASLTNNSLLLKILDSTTDQTIVTHKDGRPMSHSRIAIKYEPGGKSRPFAIVDFFSQAALKPLHQFLMRRLGEERSDGSMSHSKAAEAVKEWTKDPKIQLWSFDLTTATDRWPIELEHRVMVSCFGQEIADCWKEVISNRTFDGPSGEKVRWSVGQPLGALSSWATFAISHHAFVRTCERIDWLNTTKDELRPKPSGRKPEQYYRIIGDDITIAYHEGVASNYKNYLEKFGLAISQAKSILPQQYLQPAAELAKRVFLSGQEMTPVAPDTIIEYSKPFGQRTLLEASLMRGYSSACSPYPVQSTRLSRNEWALLTFPFRNLLPQLKGVKQLIPYYQEGALEGPAGLKPGWFVWGTTPDSLLLNFVQEFLLEQVRKAESDAYETSRLFTADEELSNIPFQGGDWQPDNTKNRNQIVLEVLKYVTNKLRGISFDLRSIIDINEYDFYEFLGRFHVFLDPKLLVFGRKSKDQKQETRILLSKVVRHCLSRIDSDSKLPVESVRMNILTSFKVLY